MKNILLTIALIITGYAHAQQFPFDTATWEINAAAHVLENIKGQDAIYLQNGTVVLKNETFKNGTIEFDVLMTERQSFPGISFHILEDSNNEQFYLRPHQSGNPDANQYTPIWNGLAGWQLYFGPAYSFVYDYTFDSWTHVKLVVNEDKGQVYLDHAKQPNLSFTLKHGAKNGGVALNVSYAPMHFANFRMDKSKYELVDFELPAPVDSKNIVTTWEISSPLNEAEVSHTIGKLNNVSWKKAKTEENQAVNIASIQNIQEGRTVYAKLVLNSNTKQILPFEFGYSDRVVVFVNGEAIYSGNNRWRTRDYRYLGTIGLFDSVILHLEKGDNTILFAVSEDFGGWGIMGRVDQTKVSIK